MEISGFQPLMTFKGESIISKYGSQLGIIKKQLKLKCKHMEDQINLKLLMKELTTFKGEYSK